MKLPFSILFALVSASTFASSDFGNVDCFGAKQPTSPGDSPKKVVIQLQRSADGIRFPFRYYGPRLRQPEAGALQGTFRLVGITPLSDGRRLGNFLFQRHGAPSLAIELAIAFPAGPIQSTDRFFGNVFYLEGKAQQFRATVSCYRR